MGKPALAKLLIRIMKIVTSKTKATLMLDTSVYEAIKARVGLVHIWVNWLSSSWLGLIIVTILTLAIVQWQPIPNIIAKQMLTPKTGTPKLEKQMLTPKTGTPKLDIRFFCVK
jgi:uncharacterized PurR-regulated membrane protein YhhQ (DUF165 family)